MLGFVCVTRTANKNGKFSERGVPIMGDDVEIRKGDRQGRGRRAVHSGAACLGLKPKPASRADFMALTARLKAVLWRREESRFLAALGMTKLAFFTRIVNPRSDLSKKALEWAGRMRGTIFPPRWRGPKAAGAAIRPDSRGRWSPGYSCRTRKCTGRISECRSNSKRREEFCPADFGRA